LVAAMQLRPAAITAYRRLAFVGNRYEPGVRITFDMELTGRVSDLTLRHSAPNFSLLGVDHCVLEVKSDETVPNWVTSILARNGCQIQRMSKYCAAIAGLSGIHVPSLVIKLPDAVDAHRRNTLQSKQAEGIGK
jgi:SPX domain protein involved in polyphosphate accumulation